MGTIPAPDIFHDAQEIAQAPQNAMAEYARVAALNQQTQQARQMGPLQQQQAQQQIQAQQRQFSDQDALTKAITQYDPSKNTLADVPKLITQNGGSGQAALQAQQGLLTQKQNLMKLGDDQFAQQQKQADLVQGVHDEVTQAKPEDKQSVYTQGLQRLSAAGLDMSKEPPQYPGDDVFAQHLAPIQLHSAIIADAAKQREADQNAAKARNENAQAAHQEFINKLTENSKPGDFDTQVDAMFPPGDAKGQAQNQFVKGQVNAFLGRGDVDSAKKVIEGAYTNQLGINKDVAVATNPAIQQGKLEVARATAQAQQDVKNGSAEDAGRGLALGQYAPSEIAARSNPSFLVQANKAALAIDPNYNAQKAEADFNVAKSSANSPFFGSAKSLTDKGGTLDQLAANYKKLPNGALPLFNKLSDYVSYQAGDPAMAGFMQTAIGAADDYAKVMGGGTGTDSARLAVLQSLSHAHNQGQMDAAIQSARDAVGSQIKSRIGNNKAMQRMYGDNISTGGGMIRARDPQGKLHEAPAGTPLPQGWTPQQ